MCAVYIYIYIYIYMYVYMFVYIRIYISICKSQITEIKIYENNVIVIYNIANH